MVRRGSGVYYTVDKTKQRLMNEFKKLAKRAGKEYRKTPDAQIEKTARNVIAGPPGPQGPQGLQGERDAQGERGLQGERGKDGKDEKQGERELQGLHGERGLQGLQGEK